MPNDLQEWFNSLYNNYINNNILLLCVKDRKTFREIEEHINRSNFNLQFVQLQNLKKEILNSKNRSQKHIIAYSINEFSFGHLSIFKHENLKIILMRITDSQQLFQCFSTTTSQPLSQQFWVMQKQDIQAILLSLNGIDFMRSFISDFITSNIISKKSVDMFLYRNTSISNETILGDIEFLQHKSILTSRLAIFIYKICTFDYDASDKTIGKYFSKYYGRSKVVNGKAFGVVNRKGYSLKNINFQEQQIRSEIAKKLYQLGVTNETIFSATGINLQ